MKRLAILSSHPIQYYAPLFRALAQRMDVEVMYANRSTPEQQASAGFGTPFEWDVDLLSGYTHRFLRNVSRTPGTQEFSGCDTPDVGQHLRKRDFDAVLTMGWHLKSFLQGIWAAKRSGIPVMIRGDSHLNTPRHAIKRALKAVAYPALLRVFDAALYVGKRNHDYYRHYNYPEARLFHVPHCVDTEWFAKRGTKAAGIALRAEIGIPANADVVLFAGKYVPFKRPLDVLDAVKQASRHRPVTLLMAGSGPLADSISARAKESGIPMHDLGFCNQSKMPAVYAAAQLLVLPSTSRETWGLVCNEALSCGTPIVVSDAVGCAPDLAEGGAGRQFPMGDTAALSQTIVETLECPPPIETIRKASAAHSIAAAVDGIESALRAIPTAAGDAAMTGA